VNNTVFVSGSYCVNDLAGHWHDLMPLDEFVPCAAFHMQVVDDPDAELPIFTEIRELLKRYEPKVSRLEGIERFAFYERVQRAFTVIITGERRLYGNLLLKKGIVRP